MLPLVKSATMYHLNETSNEDYPVALMANGQTDTLPVTNGHHNGKEEVTLFLSREMLAFNSETTGSLISDRSVNQIVGNYLHWPTSKNNQKDMNKTYVTLFLHFGHDFPRAIIQ